MVRQRDVLALVVPSLLTSCYKQTCYKLDEFNAQPCYKLLQQLVIRLQSTTCQQVVSHKDTNLVQLGKNNSIATNLLTSLLQACREHNLLTSCTFLRVHT